MKKNYICLIIVILEILMLSIFSGVKKEFSHDGYTFLLKDTSTNVSSIEETMLVRTYEITAGDSFVGDTILVTDNASVQFHDVIYNVDKSGFKDTSFELDITSENAGRVTADETSSIFYSTEESNDQDLQTIKAFAIAVLVRNHSPIYILIIFILDIIGWIFLKYPGILFYISYSWRYREELNPSELYLIMMQCSAYGLYALGIWMTYQYLFV